MLCDSKSASIQVCGYARYWETAARPERRASADGANEAGREGTRCAYRRERDKKLAHDRLRDCAGDLCGGGPGLAVQEAPRS